MSRRLHSAPRLRRAGFSAALLGAAFGIGRAPARGAQFSWRMGFSPTRENPLAVRAVEAAAKIRKDTGGALDIQVFPNSALGSDTSMLGQLRSGAIEMVAQGGGAISGVIPQAQIESVAYAFPDRKTVFSALDGDLGKAIRDEIAAKGLIAMDRVFDNGFRLVTTSTKPIRDVADLQGFKLRSVPSRLFLDTFRSLGAAPVGIELGEIYTALQTHLVDGQESPLLYIPTFKFYEVQKYCSLTQHIWGGFWIIANAAQLAALPREMQESVRRHFNDAALSERKDVVAQERSVRDKLARLGLIFNSVDPAGFRAKLAASGYYARWKAEFGAPAWTALEKYAGPLG